MKRAIHIIFILSLLAGLVCPVYGNGPSAGISNTYLYDYTQPPLFQPSLNGQFTSLADSATAVLANPAGIMKVNTIEAVFGMSSLVRNPIVSRSDTYYKNDESMEEDLPGTAKAGISFRFTDDRTASTDEARAIPLLDEYSKGGGINYFGLTFRVSESLGFAFSRQRPTALNINMNMTIPEMTDITLDLRGFEELDENNDGFRIRNDGYLEFLDDGTPIATSDAPAYAGFLDQSTEEVNWINVRINNTVVNQQSVVVTTGFKTGQIDWGINLIPMTYNINFDNDISINSDDENGNLKFIAPDLFNDPTSFEVAWWATVEATIEAGYIAKEVATHPTATMELAGAVVAGRYSGSALRMDLGAKWEPNDMISFGLMYENFNNAKMILSGTDVVHYVQHWIDQDSEMPTPEGEVWEPFLSTPTHETEAEKYIQLGSTLPPIVLPSKLKFGFAFKKPVVFALDWEQWQNEVAINTDPGSTEGGSLVRIRNINFIKAGLESRILFLPIIFRGSLTMLLKPTTDDPTIQSSLDDFYSDIPILPIEGDMYFSAAIYGGELGVGFGGGGMPLTLAMAADMTKIAKIYFMDIFYARDNWKVSYQMTTDPILTVLNSDLSGAEIGLEDIDFATTSTLSIGFKF